MIFFISDTHFGHENIIKYCKRPFDTVEGMDETLIYNWNNVVNPTDTVYHIGDLTLSGDAQKYIGQLNGMINILSYPYHHDRYWLRDVKRGLHVWNKQNVQLVLLSGLEVLDFPASDFGMLSNYKHSISLCHYEMKNWDRKHYNSWHLFGHDHRKQNTFDGNFSMNVGVDANRFKPVSLLQIKDYMIGNGWVI